MSKSLKAGLAYVAAQLEELPADLEPKLMHARLRTIKIGFARLFQGFEQQLIAEKVIEPRKKRKSKGDITPPLPLESKKEHPRAK